MRSRSVLHGVGANDDEHVVPNKLLPCTRGESSSGERASKEQQGSKEAACDVWFHLKNQKRKFQDTLATHDFSAWYLSDPIERYVYLETENQRKREKKKVSARKKEIEDHQWASGARARCAKVENRMPRDETIQGQDAPVREPKPKVRQSLSAERWGAGAMQEPSCATMHHMRRQSG